MSLHDGQADDDLEKTLDPSGAVDASLVPHIAVTPDTFRGFMPWEERLRNTQEKLRLLSADFPFLGQGNA